MIRVRATFEKKGRARYISHLDLNRCMLRIFRRSKLPIWYTEGFNPHPYYSFALALSLGFESSCEIFDFNLTDDIPYNEIMERLNSVMPEGMRIVNISEQKQKVTAITEAEYSFSLITKESDKLYSDIERLLSMNEILIDKKTKKGVQTVDIKPNIRIISCKKRDESVDMVIRLPAGTQTNLNPVLFIEALKNSGCVSFDTGIIRREGIFCENNEIFS